jgi:pyrimidine-nucleoside phosphorylase
MLRIKRDGGRHSPDDLEAFLEDYTQDHIPDYQMAAWLMAVYLRGLDKDETLALTRVMLNSGRVLDLSSLPGPTVDKHSTGGVGDKISLPLAPIVAACGAYVPMISGRGLGHTGGTLDKLESIPGFRTDLDEARFAEVLRATGVAFGAQTDDLVPADKKLYALRDVTGLVASIPLIASSILSKKLAEGLDGFVLDVKVGTGGFLKDVAMARELGETILGLCARFGLSASAQLSAMDRPLGVAIGHANEVREAIDSLRGEGPGDLWDLTRELGADLLVQGGIEGDLGAARARLDAVRSDGSAFASFVRGVAAQGGDPALVEDPTRLPDAPDTTEWGAPASGVLAVVDCRRIGLATLALGGGRRLPDDAIDMGVGLEWLATPGTAVRAGDPLVRLHHRGDHGLAEATDQLARAVAFDTGQTPLPARIERLALD